jgi:hypothetical protein
MSSLPGTRLFHVAVVISLLGMAAGASPSEAGLATDAPPHDNLESAHSLTASLPAGTFEGLFEGATKQEGEDGFEWDRSVWFTFVAPATERLTFELDSSVGHAELRFYRLIDTGQPASFENLDEIPRGFDGEGTQHDEGRFVIGAVAGTAYYASVQTGAIEESYALTWRRAYLARVLWRHTNGAASLWTVDGGGAIVASTIYGPFAGWEPQRLVVGPFGTSLMLWKHTAGAISIWHVDTGGNIVSSHLWGPFAGWSVARMAARTDGFDDLALTWTRTDGAVSIWRLVGDGSFVKSSAIYGPYAGWTPSAIAVDTEITRHLLWTSAAGAAGWWSMPSPYTYDGVITTVHGPYAGWSPHGLAAGSPDDSSRLLWRHTSGAAGLWLRDASGNITTTTAFGPFAGWQPVTLAVPTVYPDYGDNHTRVLWRHTNDSAAVWSVTASGELLKSFVYGPFAGWTAIDVAAGPE